MNFQYLYSLLQDKQAALLIASFLDPQYGTHKWRLTEGLGTRLDGSETADLLSLLWHRNKSWLNQTKPSYLHLASYPGQHEANLHLIDQPSSLKG